MANGGSGSCSDGPDVSVLRLGLLSQYLYLHASLSLNGLSCRGADVITSQLTGSAELCLRHNRAITKWYLEVFLPKQTTVSIKGK